MQTEPELNAEHSQAGETGVVRGLAPSVKPSFLLLLRSRDLLLLVLAAVLIPLVMITPFAVIRIPLGLALVLFAPGYAAILALLGDRERLSTPAMTGFSFGMSIAVIPLIALALDVTSIGIRPFPIAVALSVWIAFWTAITFRGRLLAHPVSYVQPPNSPFARWADFSLHWNQRPSHVALALFGGFVCAAVIGIALITSIVSEDIPTEFYILGSEGEARDYPRQVEAGETASVTLGIVNRDETPHVFHVSVDASDVHLADPRTRVASDGPLTIESGESYEGTISWRMPTPGTDKTVTFNLYREGDTTPYRSLRLFLDVTEQTVRTAGDAGS